MASFTWTSPNAAGVDPASIFSGITGDNLDPETNRTVARLYRSDGSILELHGSGMNKFPMPAGVPGQGPWQLGGQVSRVVLISAGGEVLADITFATVPLGTLCGSQQSPPYNQTYNSDALQQLLAGDDTLLAAAGGDLLRGFSGNDTLQGGTGNDTLYPGDGTDNVLGAEGDDTIYFGAALTAGDQADGGAGANDQLALQGDYAGARRLLLNAGNMGGIETLAIVSGHDTRFGDNSGSDYAYDLATVDANVAGGATLIVNANNLASGESLAFNGSAETDGSFFFYAALGTDNLTGGQLSDGFFFGEGGRFAPSDHVDGQGGADDQLGIRGDYSALTVFSATSIAGIETLALLSAQDSRFAAAGTAYSYNFRLDDANVASGSTLTVSGNNLRSNESMAIDGSAETDGSFRFFAGAGNDTLVGGSGADRFIGGLGKDLMTGNGGADTFYFRTTSESAVGANADRITDFAAGDHIDLSAIDADSATSGNQAFAFLDTGAFTNHAGEARIAGSGTSWTLQVDTNGDGAVDMELAITTTGGHTPAAADFIL